MGFNLGASNNTGKLNMNDFLGDEQAVQNDEKEIPINLLVPWENQPFKMYSDFKMNELVESIRENGLLSRIIVSPPTLGCAASMFCRSTPLALRATSPAGGDTRSWCRLRDIVSPATGGKYRIIAGHNRVEACRRAGFTAVPSIVKNVDENRAKLIMADTNLCQRTELLPSERAFAYKAQQEALTALGSRRATKDIAEKYGEAKRTIQRYIACTRLVPELMEMLDSGRLTLATACQFSALPNSSQEEIAAYLSRDSERKFTVEQATTLAELKFFSESDIAEICGEKVTSTEERSEPTENSAPAEPKQTVKKPSKQITLQRKEVTQLIGDELSNEEISEYFYFCLQRRDILEEWHKMYTEGKTDGSNA